MYRGKDPQKSRAPMSFIELYHYGLISHRLSTNSTSKCCIVEKKEITSFEFQSQVSQLGGTTDVWQNIRCSSRRVSFFSSNFSRAVLVLRGHAPFGQHQESRLLGRFNTGSPLFHGLSVTLCMLRVNGIFCDWRRGYSRNVSFPFTMEHEHFFKTPFFIWKPAEVVKQLYETFKASCRFKDNFL